MEGVERGWGFTRLTLGSHSTPWNVGGRGTGKMGVGHEGEEGDLKSGPKKSSLRWSQGSCSRVQPCPPSSQRQGTHLGFFSLHQSHLTGSLFSRCDARRSGYHSKWRQQRYAGGSVPLTGAPGWDDGGAQPFQPS